MAGGAFRIEALKGMDSSVVKGMGDSPYYLKNVVNHRNGGYAPAPTGVLILENVLAFKQFSYSRYAYVKTTEGSALFDFQESAIYPYSVPGYRDVAVYGDRVVTSGADSIVDPDPFFGVGVTRYQPISYVPPTPEEGLFSHVATRSYDLKLGVAEIIPNVRLTVVCIPRPASEYIVAPTDAYSHFVSQGNSYSYDTGRPYLITVYFRRSGNTDLGTVINPGSASTPYLIPMFVLHIPKRPNDASGNPIFGQYTIGVTVENLPSGYEAVFYGSAQKIDFVNESKMWPSKSALDGPVAIEVNDTVMGHLGDIWLAKGAGTLTTAFYAKDLLSYAPGRVFRHEGVDYRFLGYSEFQESDGAVYNSDAYVYDYFVHNSGMNAPTFLMAEYVNRRAYRSSAEPMPTEFYWARLMTTRGEWSYDGNGMYIIRREHHSDMELNPSLSSFFPMGTRSVFSNGRTWVAAEYVITSKVSGAAINDVHTPHIINYVTREYANNGQDAAIKTLYYSEPGQPLDFRESFIIPPMRKSHSITALAATSSGIIVFGEADACLISGDSPANFRATALDIPGTISQATIGSYKGSVVYANTEGLYLLDGGTPTLVSDPVSQNWGVPRGVSINSKAGTVLVSFTDRPCLHYDIRRKDWNIWSMVDLIGQGGGYAIPVEQEHHTAAQNAPGNLAHIFSMKGPGTPYAEARFYVDAGSPETRKTFRKLSYRREGGSVRLGTRTGSGAYRVSSTTTDNEAGVMMHVLSQHGNALDFALEFGQSTVLGGPIVIQAEGVKDATDIREG